MGESSVTDVPSVVAVFAESSSASSSKFSLSNQSLDGVGIVNTRLTFFPPPLKLGLPAVLHEERVREDP